MSIQHSFLKVAALFMMSSTLLLVSAHKGHSCGHDNDTLFKEASKRMADYLQANPFDRSDEGRNLQAAVTINPIRVTSDMSGLSSGGTITASQITYLTSISNVVVSFLKNFIKVQPNPNNNIFNPSQTDGTCLTVTIPTNDKTTGIANSDLHLYFIYTDDSNQGFLANAGFCNLQQTSNYIRPNFGRVMFNIANMKAQGNNYAQFENDIMVTLHEVIHVLGFSSGAMQNWFNKSTKQVYGTAGASALITTQTIRGKATNLLNTINVLKTAKKYYKCDSLVGMQLENQGSAGSIGSHWERTVIRSEIMTASALAEGLNLSVFSVALLKDTGYWDDVNENMTDPIYWGKGKGCDFFINACTSSTSYEEFTTKDTLKCSFWNDGQGVGDNSDPFGDSCYVTQAYSNRLCEDASLNSEQTTPVSYNSDILNDYNYNSKCFDSTVYNPSSQYTYPGVNQRCHQYQCTPDKTQITITFSKIPSFSVVCALADQGKVKSVTYNSNTLGNLTCPSDYIKFCDNQNCKNFCSYKGICIRGVCLCNPGATGDDCNVACAVYSNTSGICVTTCTGGTYANPDNVCRSTCPDGYYPNTNVCSLCDFSCSKCSGPSSSQCTACQFLTFLDGNKCTETCSTGTYADETTKTCKTCPTGCVDCTSATVCGSCKPGYTKSGNICSSNNCNATCATCTGTPTECLSCPANNYLFNKTCVANCNSGYYKDTTNMICAACSTGCTTCSNSTTCTVCDTANGYRLQGNSCTLCKLPCATCLVNDVNKCTACEGNQYLLVNTCYTTCPDGYYNGNNYQCAKCIDGCSKCTVANTCDVCNTASGYQAFTYNSKQICITSTSCFSPCLTCTGTFQPTTCNTCIANYYKQGDLCKVACDDGYYGNSSDFLCKQCSTECTKCTESATKCTACVSPKYAYNGSCVLTCPTGYSGANGACTSLVKTSSLIMRFSFFIMAIIVSLF